MKHPFLALTVAAAMVCAACESPKNAMTRADSFGNPAPASAAARAVTITPNTYYVEVADDETVKFIVGDKSFAWTFDGPSDGYAFDLERVAPPGLFTHKVEAIVAANPLVVGGPGE